MRIKMFIKYILLRLLIYQKWMRLIYYNTGGSSYCDILKKIYFFFSSLAIFVSINEQNQSYLNVPTEWGVYKFIKFRCIGFWIIYTDDIIFDFFFIFKHSILRKALSIWSQSVFCEILLLLFFDFHTIMSFYFNSLLWFYLEIFW